MIYSYLLFINNKVQAVRSEKFSASFIGKENKTCSRLRRAQPLVRFTRTSLDPRQADHRGVLSQLTVLLVVSTLQSFSEELGKQC